NKLLELGEKSKIIIHESIELNSENKNLKKKIETKENELTTISNGKNDIIKILQNRINKLTEDNEILLNNYNNLSNSYKKVCLSQNNTTIIQNQAKSLQEQTINQEKRINDLMNENLKLEKEIGRISNENNSLKESNQELNDQLNISKKENMELIEKSNKFNKELNSYKGYISKYENIIDDYRYCLKELNMNDYFNNFPFIFPKVLLNAIKKIKRENNYEKQSLNGNEINYNNNIYTKQCNETFYNNNETLSKSIINTEMRSIDKSIEKIEKEHNEALKQINQISYENGI
ncbi:hypothetical protein BCR32DRAFT_302874, partial [Anaeromyces robustus]